MYNISRIAKYLGCRDSETGAEMYKDYFPPLPRGVSPPTPVVAVVTLNERVRPEAVLHVCRAYGATSVDADGAETFWVVFEDEPKRAWDFTEAGLRSSVDEDGYIKCRGYEGPDDKRKPMQEVPMYLRGVGI